MYILLSFSTMHCIFVTFAPRNSKGSSITKLESNRKWWWALQSFTTSGNSSSGIQVRFTLWLSVEKTKDLSNLVGQEQKFVLWAFTLEANGQKTMPSKTPTWQNFLWVSAPRIWPVHENLSTVLTPKRLGRHFVAFGWVQRAVEHRKRSFFIQKKAV
jgi:hypothetical protein